MKHFSAQTGGRFTYVDDVMNLQELALAFNAIFTECDNFVISGCRVSGQNISSGYVYLNKEIRYFQGASGVSSWPRYLYESNSSENVAYASGTDKVGRTVYGCTLGSSVPTSLDPITGAVPTYIKFTSTGALQMKDALFGKYALILDPASGSQLVKGTVQFQNAVNISGILSLNNTFKLISGESVCQMSWDGNNMTIQSRVGTGTIYKLVVDNTGGYKLYSGSTLLCTIGDDGISTAKSIASTAGLIGGNVKITGSAIYNNGTSGNTGALNINMVGYNGGTTNFRDTFIGNGKGTAIISVTGSTAKVDVAGVMTVASGDVNGLIIKSTYAKTSPSMLKAISFRDANDESVASIGFISSDSKLFSINNALANIEITGTSFVNIGPAIKENGQLLSSKYVLASSNATAMALKADLSSVYTRTQADARYGKLTGGISQFITGSNTAAVLRSQLGAMSQNDVTSLCPTLSNLLADMATTEAKKAAIRQNIGAASASDSYEPIIADSGWKYISGTTGLYVRQIGKVVCIQGRVTTIHSGTVFTLPNGIDAPRYSASFCFDPRGLLGGAWSAQIAGGTKQCTVVSCDGDCGYTIPFSLTYMT